MAFVNVDLDMLEINAKKNGYANRKEDNVITMHVENMDIPMIGAGVLTVLLLIL